MIKGIRPSLAQAGAIKIGKLSEEEKTSRSGAKWRPPVKLDHFLVTKTNRGSDGNLEVDEALMKSLKNGGFADSDGKIRSIPIVLHSDDIDEVFPTVYAWYKGKQVVCRGDGEKATRWRVQNNVKTGETKEIACPCEFLDKGDCKPHGVLHCTIAMRDHAVAGAVYRYRTTGIISIQRIIGSLEQILAVVGTITNIPLVLRVTPVTVSPDGKTRTVYSVHVELRNDVVASQQAALEARKAREALGAPKVSVRALLQAPASDDEDPDEQAAVEAEFYPNNIRDSKPAPKSETEKVKKAAKTTKSKKEVPPEDVKKELDALKSNEVAKKCPSCEALCPEQATICHKCGKDFPESEAMERAVEDVKEALFDDQPADDEPDYGAPDA